MGFFGNMMNNYYYGKAGKGDYRVSDMPTTRLQLFGAVMKVRWASLFGVNILYMVFWLPTMFWTVLNISMLLSATELVLDSSMAQSYMTAYLIGLIPCILITGPFSAGVAYVTRNWARDEHSFVWSDFWQAVRENWKQSLVVSLISSLLPFLAYVSWFFYGQKIGESLFFIVPMALTLIALIVWKLSEMLIYTMMVTYDLKLLALIRNSILLTVARFPLAILIKLITWVLPIIGLSIAWFIPDALLYVIFALIILYLFYLPGFNRLVQAAYANASCEKFLNTQIEGARTNIGLRPDDWDDTEYIPQDDEE